MFQFSNWLVVAVRTHEISLFIIMALLSMQSEVCVVKKIFLVNNTGKIA